MPWIMLLFAGALEMVWALALKQSDGLTKLGPTALFLVAGAASFILLALALRDIPVGTAYAVWTGIGAVGVALAGIILLSEPLTAARLIAIGMIAGGIVWLALAS